MNTITVTTFTASIYVGRKNRDTGVVHPMSLAQSICQKYCDFVGLCVTLTETEFIYTKGAEPGFIVGLINYPRFPDAQLNIKVKAVELAKLLLIEFEQFKVSIVFPDETMMIGKAE